VVLRAGFGSLQDDDAVGTATPADATGWCLEATRGGNLETWWAPLSGGRHALALFNWSPSPDAITVAWSQLPGLAEDARVAVRGVWRHEDVGVFRGNFTARVPSHGTELFVLTPA